MYKLQLWLTNEFVDKLYRRVNKKLLVQTLSSTLQGRDKRAQLFGICKNINNEQFVKMKLQNYLMNEAESIARMRTLHVRACKIDELRGKLDDSHYTP